MALLGSNGSMAQLFLQVIAGFHYIVTEPDEDGGEHEGGDDTDAEGGVLPRGTEGKVGLVDVAGEAGAEIDEGDVKKGDDAEDGADPAAAAG